MGVFNDRLLVRGPPEGPAKWPIPIKLCTFLRIQFSENEVRPDEFIFEYIINEKSLGPMKGLVRTDPAQQIALITIFGQGIPLEKGTLGFRLSLKKSGNAVQEFNLPKAIQIIDETVLAQQTN